MSRPSRVLSRDGWWYAAIGLVVMAGFAGCAKTRSEGPPIVTWNANVGRLFEAHCVECHGGDDPAGGYDLTSYLGALGSGSDDVPNAIAGDASSTLLTVLGQGAHAGYLDEAQKALVERWVVEDDLAYFYSGFHGPEILNPRAQGFHGHLVAETGWTMDSCRECHGQDYAGGFYGVSCNGCHQNTPAACDTCHGMGAEGAPPPAVYPGHTAGAHQPHLTGADGFDPVRCGACHIVPQQLSSPGHVDNADDQRAEVVFGGLALTDGAEPTYDPAAMSCASTYCHARIDGADKPDPVWTEPDAIVSECTSCHGFPPETLVNGGVHPAATDCSRCHPTAGPDDTIVRPDLHVNGSVDFVANAACDTCHSGPADPVPFLGVSGQPAPGAHDAHVGASPFHAEPNGLGYACGVCHLAPTQVNSPGHLDGKIEFDFVGPAKGTANLDPSFDPATGTCSSTWCHGAALVSGPTASPAWTSGTAAQCGDCHGIPPPSEPHGEVGPNSCYQCHGLVIGPDMQFRDLSLHVDGKVEFNQ